MRAHCIKRCRELESENTRAMTFRLSLLLFLYYSSNFNNSKSIEMFFFLKRSKGNINQCQKNASKF